MQRKRLGDKGRTLIFVRFSFFFILFLFSLFWLKKYLFVHVFFFFLVLLISLHIYSLSSFFFYSHICSSFGHFFFHSLFVVPFSIHVLILFPLIFFSGTISDRCVSFLFPLSFFFFFFFSSDVLWYSTPVVLEQFLRRTFTLAVILLGLVRKCRVSGWVHKMNR